MQENRKKKSSKKFFSFVIRFHLGYVLNKEANPNGVNGIENVFLFGNKW